VSKKILGHRKRKQVNGISKDLRKLCEEKRNARLECTRNPSSPSPQFLLLSSFKLQQEYRNLNKKVKSSVKILKGENLVKKIETLKEDF